MESTKVGNGGNDERAEALVTVLKLAANNITASVSDDVADPRLEKHAANVQANIDQKRYVPQSRHWLLVYNEVFLKLPAWEPSKL